MMFEERNFLVDASIFIFDIVDLPLQVILTRHRQRFATDKQRLNLFFDHQISQILYDCLQLRTQKHIFIGCESISIVICTYTRVYFFHIFLKPKSAMPENVLFISKSRPKFSTVGCEFLVSFCVCFRRAVVKLFTIIFRQGSLKKNVLSARSHVNTYKTYK